MTIQSVGLEDMTDFEKVAEVKCESCHGHGTFTIDGAQSQCYGCLGTGYKYHWLWRQEYNTTKCLTLPMPHDEEECSRLMPIEHEGNQLLGLLRVAKEEGAIVAFHSDHVEVWRDGTRFEGAALAPTLTEALNITAQ